MLSGLVARFARLDVVSTIAHVIEMVADDNRNGLAIVGQEFCAQREIDVAEAARKQTLSDARKKVRGPSRVGTRFDA